MMKSWRPVRFPFLEAHEIKILSKLVHGFLEYKKQNGYVYTTGEYHLNKYLDSRYLISIPYDCHVPRRHLVLPAMYRLLYCCGLRCKEVRMLKCESVHPEKNYIDILQSKGPKHRRLFISQQLSDYLRAYNIKMDHVFPNRTFFFPSREDTPYGANAFQKNFLKIWYTAFPEKQGNGVSIRAYDFRHHFAYTNMNRWLKEGHQDIKNTLYYFHLVPAIYHAVVEKSSLFEYLLPEVDGYE